MYVNNDYMQNFNYYNQNSYCNLGQRHSGVYSNGYNNLNYQTNGLYNNATRTGYINNQNQFNTLYPDIYKIIYPIVNNLVSTVNLSMIDNNLINNMTDTVLNILDGECQKQNVNNSNNINDIVKENSNDININSNKDKGFEKSNNDNSNNNNSNTINHIENQFLKDIIRIIILKEISKLINNFNFNMFLDNIYI